MSLDTLHFEAGVPHYAAKLQKSMNRFFKALTPDKPVERNNVSHDNGRVPHRGPSNSNDSFLSNLTTACTGPTAWAIKGGRKLHVCTPHTSSS